ncbi:MAG: flagellar biosynthesis protein FlgD [Bradyrhizobium sp.]|uniref:flagellar hook assembly protein FlgD n=1 Tax=Bradyrhizobium sp. TaxID=376 RepID=UPI001D90FAA8|nr:flagellar hook capping FlgD N-terminal domain-containing protein [Bradyrhizobium sp.]MBV9560953.1 flagellar biosynthesis protein FlgD [Bradyrhizobium sp.]
MASSGAVMASPIVSGTTPQSTSGSTASSANAMANQQIAGNFQTFLQLLTTQLQNQNPLDPLDTNQFTQQLVQFAGVQEQINTNDSLTTLVKMQQTAQATQALEFVGKTAIVSGNTTAMSNSKATWELNVPQTSTINISIANSSGQTVFTGQYSANAGDNQPFSWNGVGNDGTQWPDGSYTLTATAQDSTGNSVAISTLVGGTVSAVDLTQSPPLLTINGQSYTISQVKAIGAGSS